MTRSLVGRARRAVSAGRSMCSLVLSPGPGLGGGGRAGDGGSALEHEAVAEVVQEVALEPLGEGDPGVAQGGGGLVGQLTCQLAGPWEELVGRQDLADDTEPQGLLGRELLAGEQEV